MFVLYGFHNLHFSVIISIVNIGSIFINCFLVYNLCKKKVRITIIIQSLAWIHNFATLLIASLAAISCNRFLDFIYFYLKIISEKNRLTRLHVGCFRCTLCLVINMFHYLKIKLTIWLCFTSYKMYLILSIILHFRNHLISWNLVQRLFISIITEKQSFDCTTFVWKS